MVSSCTSFTLPSNKLVVSIKAAEDGGKTSYVLVDSWVLLDDVPPLMRNTPALMAFAELLGKPISIDSALLARLVPVHMFISYLDPSRVRGYVQIFPGNTAFRIAVHLEGHPPCRMSSLLRHPLPCPKMITPMMIV